MTKRRNTKVSLLSRFKFFCRDGSTRSKILHQRIMDIFPY